MVRIKALRHIVVCTHKYLVVILCFALRGRWSAGMVAIRYLGCCSLYGATKVALLARSILTPCLLFNDVLKCVYTEMCLNATTAAVMIRSQIFFVCFFCSHFTLSLHIHKRMHAFTHPGAEESQ